MASDRGTITRGPGADQPSAWGEPTRPGDRRMPGARRERKPALAILAVLLIVGGALAAGVLVLKSGQRVGAVEITQTVPADSPIPASAIREVQIAADSGVNYVSWQYAGQVPQYFAISAIPAGTLLNKGMITKTLAVPNGDDEVGLALKDGQVPDNLQDGDQVNVYSTQSATTGCPGKPGSLLATGTVIEIQPGSSDSGVTDVVIAGPAGLFGGATGTVVCNTANGTAGIAIVPASTAGTG
jgi:hypothetical protein